MKRFLLLVIFIPNLVFAEEILFRVVETTPFWNDFNFPSSENVSGEIPKGSIVEGRSGMYFSRQKILEGIPVQQVFHNNRKVLAYANSLLPLETQDLFDQRLLHDSGRSLLFSFYVNALISNDREVIYMHNQQAWDDFLDLQNAGEYIPFEWWEFASARAHLQIAQTSLRFNSDERGRYDLLVKNITRIENGYCVTVAVAEYMGRWWSWSDSVVEQDIFTILLILDGDYLDLYLYDTDNLIETFAFVDNNFLTQLNNLIEGYSVDLSHVTYPRRADGSMDISPPAIEVEPVSEVAEPPAAAVGNAQNAPATSAMPLWVWLVIGGGAVFLLAVVAVVVPRKR